MTSFVLVFSEIDKEVCNIRTARKELQVSRQSGRKYGNQLITVDLGETLRRALQQAALAL